MLYNIIVSSYQRDNNRTNGRIGDAVRGYPSEQCSRNHNSPDTAGNGNFASLIPISYCANHDLPSPTDWLGEDYVVARVDDVRLLESVSTEEVFKTDAITLSDNTHRFTLFHLVRLRSPRRHLLIFLL